jgi:hypothetical protein
MSVHLYFLFYSVTMSLGIVVRSRFSAMHVGMGVTVVTLTMEDDVGCRFKS